MKRVQGFDDDPPIVDAPVGSRKWVAFKAVQNLFLLGAPLVLLWLSVKAFIWPEISVEVEGRYARDVGQVFYYRDGADFTATQVRVLLDDPAFLDRLIVAAPGLAFTVIVGYLSYALWRIEINITGHHRPFTERDAQVLRRATAGVIHGFWGLVVLELLSVAWFTWGATGQAHTALDRVSSFALLLGAFLAVLSRIYRKAWRQAAELEQGV